MAKVDIEIPEPEYVIRLSRAEMRMVVEWGELMASMVTSIRNSKVHAALLGTLKMSLMNERHNARSDSKADVPGASESELARSVNVSAGVVDTGEGMVWQERE